LADKDGGVKTSFAFLGFHGISTFFVLSGKYLEDWRDELGVMDGGSYILIDMRILFSG
jgi:hypothetical protein